MWGRSTLRRPNGIAAARVPGVATAAVILVALALAPTALATQRFADPAGASTGTCAPPDPPCTLERAVEDPQTVDDDEVIVLPGAYNLGGGDLAVDNRIDLHGAVGAKPRITSTSGGSTVSVTGGTSANAKLHDLAIANTGSGGGLFMNASGALAERLVVTNTSTAQACQAWSTTTVTVRDSTCVNEGNGPGVGYFVGTAASLDLQLRNVIAISEGTGIFAHGVSIGGISGGTFTATAKNVIASGGTSDANAVQGGMGTTATLTFEYSNYDLVNPSATGTVTPAGSGTNQVAPPTFVDAAGGDFHQAPGSPTIDAGGDDGTLGSLDIDGEPRLQGSAVDIGADETANPPVPSPEPGDSTSPDTQITKKPKDKTKKKTATFEFSSTEVGSTFECKLDDGQFAPCSSPDTLKVKKGKHSFEVRARDAAGNVDASPASDDWKVKKKKKK